jgi:uncharacterized OB-fold protein
MEATAEFVAGRPLPLLDNVSRPWWEATARGELLYQECPACGHRQFYPRSICTRCAAEPEWRTASGRGKVHTFTVVRQNYAPPFKRWAPYTVAIVELEEGVRIEGNVVGIDPDEVAIGLEVEVAFVPLDDESSLPFWRPRA